eukprot:scaffold34620_cov160-Amphora_coffeaeformis.AAC.13
MTSRRLLGSLVGGHHHRRRFNGSSLVWLSLWLTATMTIAFSSAEQQAPSWPKMTGLRNLGNTCYLNSQLQCAYQIPLVRSMILKNPIATSTSDTSDDDSDSDDEREETTPESPGLLALRSVFADMAKVAGTGRSVSPVILTRTLGIPVMEQQDSQEFWKLLLPALQLPRLTDLYQGAFEDYIVAADKSGREKRREETFLDISLDVVNAHDVPSSLAAAFGQPELLQVSQGNGWRPAKGADKVDALKGSRLRAQGLPSILQLHLKRFTYDWNRDVMEKANVPFAFAQELDLSALCDDDDKNNKKDCLLYDLQGVVIHVGEFNVGHYYAYVRPDLDSDRWFRINDDLVDEVTWEEVLKDAIGGKVTEIKKRRLNSGTSQKKGFFQRLLSRFGDSDGLSGSGPYGFGGQTSNAYVLQYVKRSDRDRLYKESL